MSAWKQFERDCAAFFGTARFPANTGGKVDFESEFVVAQCKLVRTMSLSNLTQLAEQMANTAAGNQVGIVCVKLRRGRGRKSAPLVVMTFAQAEQAGLLPR